METVQGGVPPYGVNKNPGGKCKCIWSELTDGNKLVLGPYVVTIFSPTRFLHQSDARSADFPIIRSPGATFFFSGYISL